MDPHATTRARSAVGPSETIDLATMRAVLAALEALEEEVQHREAHLRALLPPEQFRLAWALRDAEERHGQAERLLAIHRLADELVRQLPAHEAPIRAAVRWLLREGVEVDESA